MSEQLRRYMAPFGPLQVVFDAPKRHTFVVQRFKGMMGALKLLWNARKHSNQVKAEQAFNDAITAHSIGHYTQAEELYTTCIRLYPDHEPAYTNLAALYMERNGDDLAVEEMKKALRVRPYFYRGYYNLGLIYRQMGRIDEAIGMLNQAISYNEEHFYSYVVLAEIYVARNEFDEAIKHYLLAMPFCTSPQAIYMRLAELYLKNRDLGNCESCLRKAIALKELPELHYNLGWLLASRDAAPDELVDCFLKARVYRPDFKEALLNLALCQAAAGYHELAVENMLKYVQDFGEKTPDEMLQHLNYLRQINPANHYAAMKVAQLYIDSNQVQKAIEVLSSVLSSLVQFSPAIEMLAEIYRRMGRYKEAITTYRRMIEVAPENVVGFLGLARSYGDIENFSAAMPVLKKVLELDPHNADVHYQYATMMAQEGNFTLALKHYKKVATLDVHYPRIQKRIRMLEEELENETESDSPQRWPIARRSLLRDSGK